MAWCLNKEAANKFLDAIRTGKLNPQVLINMTSEQRRKFLALLVGEKNAKEVNTLFESKLLLKNQQRGIISWAKKVGGMTEGAKTDIVDKINRLGDALNPKTEQQFLEDIVEKRLGTAVSAAEAKTIFDLTKKAEQAYNPKLEKWQQSKEYWQAKQQLVKYIRDIAPQFIPTTLLGKIGRGVEVAISVERAIKTGFDLSAALRQGRAYFGTREWTGAFKRMFKYAKSSLAIDELEVKIMSHRYSEYALKVKKELGLTLLGESFTQREEQFGAKLIDKVPLLRGSERAYTGFLNDLRFNRFVKILGDLDKRGKGITDNTEAMKDLAKVIGAATGRGTLGSLEGAARPLATVLFAPRWVASRVEVLINPLIRPGPARTESALALARWAGTSAAMLGMAKMAGAEVESNFQSSDAGKIKIGNTRIDISGGLGPYIVFTDRQLSGKIKSTTTGKITDLNAGKYGQTTRLSLFYSFFESKTSPMASILRDLLKGKTFQGKPIKLDLLSLKANQELAQYLADQLFMPLLASDALNAFQDASGGVDFSRGINIPLGVGATISSLFGLGAQTYPSKRK